MGIEEVQQLKQPEDGEHGQYLREGVEQKQYLHGGRPAGKTEPGKSIGSRNACSHGEHHRSHAQYNRVVKPFQKRLFHKNSPVIVQCVFFRQNGKPCGQRPTPAADGKQECIEDRHKADQADTDEK